MNNTETTAKHKISNHDKAKILSQALPYIQEYFGKIVVVKYGGNAMTDPELKMAVMEDVVLLSLIGVKVVLVHGGGPEITQTLTKMNIESRFVNGLRYTNKETAGVVQMVLAGKTNKDLVQLLGQCGGKAVGLCGLDGNLIQAEKLSEELGYVGRIKQIDTEIILRQLEQGYIPVIASIGGDQDGNVYNINADTVAAEISAELKAENLTLLTDIRGLLENKDDDSTLIPAVDISNVPQLVAQGIISGGMIPKIESCVRSIRRGVKKAFIIDGRILHSILVELLTNEGIGTMFYANF